MQKKEDKKQGKAYIDPEDKVIMKQQKQKKREKRRERVTEEDQFDSLFNQYKTKLEKKLDGN